MDVAGVVLLCFALRLCWESFLGLFGLFLDVPWLDQTLAFPQKGPSSGDAMFKCLKYSQLSGRDVGRFL